MKKKFFKILISLTACLLVFVFASCQKITTTLSDIMIDYNTVSQSVQLKDYFYKETLKLPNNLDDVLEKLDPADEAERELVKKLASFLQISQLPFNRFFQYLKLPAIYSNTNSEQYTSLRENLNILYDEMLNFKNQKNAIVGEATLDLNNSQNLNLFNNFIEQTVALTKQLQQISKTICTLYKVNVNDKTEFGTNSTSIVFGMIESEIYIYYLDALIPSYDVFINNLKNNELFFYFEDESFSNIDALETLGKNLLSINQSTYKTKTDLNFDTIKEEFLNLTNVCNLNTQLFDKLDDSINAFVFKDLDKKITSSYVTYSQNNLKLYLNNNCSKEQKGHYLFVCDLLSNNVSNITLTISAFLQNF